MIPKPNLLRSWQKPTKNAKPLIIAGIALLLVLSGIGGALVLTNSSASQPISPAAFSDKPQLVRQSLENEPEPISYYLAASQEYLERAKTLSRQKGLEQTASDKKKIVDLLNQSLKFAGLAVQYYPQNPQGYSQRALLYQTISHMEPSAKTKAERDLATAATLSGKDGAPPTQIKPQDLINNEPLEEASLLSQVAIALPEDSKHTEDTFVEEVTNALKGTVSIPAGETSVTVSSEALTSNTLVYFTPESDLGESILTLKTKDPKAKTFTLSLTKPLPQTLEISWWLITD